MTVEIYWFDDDFAQESPEKGAVIREFNEALGSDQIHCVAPFPAGLQEWMLKLHRDEASPDLIVIDYKLTSSPGIASETPEFMQNGVQMLGVFRGEQKLIDVPVYLTSSTFQPDEAGVQRGGFDWIIDGNLGDESLEALLQAANDYKNIRGQLSGLAPGGVDVVCASLANGLVPPDDEVSDEVLALLRNVIDSLVMFGDESSLEEGLTLPITRWIRSGLLSRNGPLVDDLFAATAAGCSEEFFRNRIAPALDGAGIAAYSGYFSSSIPRRWWRGQLLAAYSELVKDLNGDVGLSERVASHFGANPSSFAVCAVCGEPWPEDVAIDHDHPRERRAVHWHCSYPSIKHRVFPGLDEVREFINRK